MKFFRAVFAFYINSSIHVAFAVTALVGLTQLYLDLPLGWQFYAFIFLGTITGYNFVKYAKVAGLHHRSLAASLKAIQVFSALCALALIVVAFMLPIEVLIYTAGFGVLTFFYAVPFIKGDNLRSLGGVKIFIVALVWAGVTVIVPVVAEQKALTLQIGLVFIQRYILVMVWVLPFEIRDVGYDRLSLGTIPQRLGINRTKAVGIVLLSVALLCEFYMTSNQVWKISAVLIMCVLTGALLLKSKKSQRVFYASFWVESIPIWWYLLAYFFIYLSF